MSAKTSTAPAVVDRAEWLDARKTLLEAEKAHTRAGDRVSALRRSLPMVPVTKDYTFHGPGNTAVSLKDLFAGRKQLIIQHFMFAPDKTEGCPSCSYMVDCLGDVRHLQARNTSLVLVSRTPYAKIEAFKARMGWNYPWYSSHGSDFNYDFDVTLDAAVKEPVTFNFRSAEEWKERGQELKGEHPGVSVFLMGGEGKDGTEIFHTYSTYGRGVDGLLVTEGLLDLTPLGRQDDEHPELPMHHDKYPAA